jgi:hypothetical protein
MAVTTMKKIKLALVLLMFAPLPIALLVHVARTNIEIAICVGVSAMVLALGWASSTRKELAASLQADEDQRREEDTAWDAFYASQHTDHSHDR